MHETHHIGSPEALLDGFKEKARRLSVVFLDQTPISEHRCQVVGEYAAVERHEVSALRRLCESHCLLGSLKSTENQIRGIRSEKEYKISLGFPQKMFGWNEKSLLAETEVTAEHLNEGEEMREQERFTVLLLTELTEKKDGDKRRLDGDKRRVDGE